MIQYSDGTVEKSPEMSKEERDKFYRHLETSDHPVAIKLRGYKSFMEDQRIKRTS